MIWPPLQSEMESLLIDLARSGAWAKYEGAATEAVIEQIKARFHRTHVQLCCSGTIGVELALRGVGIGQGHEVILAGYDFPGNFRAIEAVGGRPVLADLSPNRWSWQDTRALDAVYARDVRAVIVSHLHGDLAKMPEIMAWAQEKNVAVIEDACQAHGASIGGRPCGAWGDVSVLSFGGSKLLTAGRGGCVMTHNAQIHQRMRIFRDRGNDAFAMSELQAAVLMPQLEHLDAWHQARLKAVQYLQESLHHCWDLKTCPWNTHSTSESPAYYKWAWKVEDRGTPSGRRDRLIDWLSQRGIQCGQGFRGFAGRSSARCRRPDSMPYSIQAAEQTLLIHHTELVDGIASGQRIEANLQAWKEWEHHANLAHE